MKCMNRNKTTFYYAPYTGKTAVYDEYGNQTGEYELSYGKPVKTRANVSAAKGKVASQLFGENFNYDRTIVTDNASDLDEYAILWIDVDPALDTDGNATVPHDYVVTHVAKSLNSTMIAVSKVAVS